MRVQNEGPGFVHPQQKLGSTSVGGIFNNEATLGHWVRADSLTAPHPLPELVRVASVMRQERLEPRRDC